MPPSREEVFVSYAWTEESKTIVDQIEIALKDSGIALIRDKNEMRYKDSLRDFMNRIGRGSAIIVVLSKRYLESKSCMFELTEIAKNGNIHHRVFPVVMADSDIYDAGGRLKYIRYWEEKKRELDREMRSVGGEKLEGIREEIDLYADIRNTIAGIVNTLGDMNALDLGQPGADRSELLKALESRIVK